MQIYDVVDFIAQDLPPPQFYIKDLLPKQGSMEIFGEPGAYKSWLAEYTAFCIATGEPWIGYETEQARVLLVNTEISSLGYYWRLRDMIPRFTLQRQFFYVSSPGIIFLEEQENFNRFAASIRPFQPQVLILDCFQGLYGGDENSSQEVAVFIRNMSGISQEHHCSIVLIHHSNKSALATGLNKSRGSSRLPGWVDTSIQMVSQPSGFQLQFGKARESRRGLPRSLNVQFQDYLWTVRGVREV